MTEARLVDWFDEGFKLPLGKELGQSDHNEHWNRIMTVARA